MTEKTIDFSKFMLSDTSFVDVLDPTGQPLQIIDGQPVRISVHGAHTARYAQALKLLKNSDDEEADRLNRAEFLAHLTVDVQNFPYPGGAEAIYKERGFAFVTAQVSQHLMNQGNFWQAGATK